MEQCRLAAQVSGLLPPAPLRQARVQLATTVRTTVKQQRQGRRTLLDDRLELLAQVTAAATVATSPGAGPVLVPHVHQRASSWLSRSVAEAQRGSGQGYPARRNAPPPQKSP